jgi:putative PIN family toxin of toxin-antitoxin system
VTEAAPVWVIDTNVVVSAALSAGGNCDKILRAAVEGRIRLAWSAPILAEYREVLLRPKFCFSPQVVASLMAVFSPGDQVTPALAPSLPDPDDEVFLAAALVTTDRVLVTGNQAHFPANVCNPVKVLSPADAILLLGREK